MKKYFILFLCCLCHAKQRDLSFPILDFHEGMGSGRIYSLPEYARISNASEERQHLLEFFRKIYEERIYSVPSRTLKIPLILHQVWLGPNKPPRQFFTEWQRSWRINHPHWEYYLWTDKTLRRIKLINQDLFDRAPNWGEKSDIARLEIIDQFGGVYFDIDFESLKPLDVLHHCFDFYTGIGPFDNTPFYIGNGLMAAAPGHYIVKACIEGLRSNQDKKLVADRSGPPFFIKVLAATMHEPEAGNAIALPPAYFYPVMRKQNKLSKSSKMKLYQEESFAVHHWAGTWKKPSAYIKGKQLKKK